MKIEHVVFPSVFQTYGSVCRRSFSVCSHDPMFEANKNWILKTDRVNGTLQINDKISVWLMAALGFRWGYL